MLVLCEALQFGAAMILFGLYAMSGWIAPGTLAKTLDPALRRFEILCLAVLIGTALAWPAMVALEIEGDPSSPPADLLQTLMLDTDFGHVWFVRLALIAALAFAIALGQPAGRKVWVAAGVLGSLGSIGHALMPDGPLGKIHQAVQALHLLCAGAWIGGLVPLIVILSRAPSREAGVALRRFSVWGHGFVALALATGVANAALIHGAWPPDMQSPYTRVLLLKSGIVAAMVGVALVNRYRIVPRLRHDRDAGLGRLRRLSIGNLALGAAAVLAASLLGSLDPT